VHDEENARSRRVIDRAVFGIANETSRYRSGSPNISGLVSAIDAWIGSMSDLVGEAELDMWRREVNRLEFANASMLDEGRDDLTPEERELVHEAITALEEMCRPWTELDALERRVLEMLVAGEQPMMRRLQEQLTVCGVRGRERTGVGFFTTLDVDRSVAEPVDLGSARVGDVVAEMEGLGHGAGFLLMIEVGYLHQLEGYSYDERWPDEVERFSLAYVQQPRDLTALTSTERAG
jgi:hypothetical protein